MGKKEKEKEKECNSIPYRNWSSCKDYSVAEIWKTKQIVNIEKCYIILKNIQWLIWLFLSKD